MSANSGARMHLFEDDNTHVRDVSEVSKESRYGFTAHTPRRRRVGRCTSGAGPARVRAANPHDE
jgi:hypothetical protein